MKCRMCDSELPPDAAFCPKCGAQAQSTGAAAADANSPEPPPERVRSGANDRRDLPEQELWQGTYSPKAMVGAAVGAGISTIAGIVLGFMLQNNTIWLIILLGILALWLVLGGNLLYRRLSIYYRLTNQRFFHHSGILRRVVDRVEVIDMDDITYVQGVIDRLLGIGTIKISSSDRTHPELYLRGIDNVQQVAAQIDAARRAERVRRGLHLETI